MPYSGPAVVPLSLERLQQVEARVDTACPNTEGPGPLSPKREPKSCFPLLGTMIRSRLRSLNHGANKVSYQPPTLTPVPRVVLQSNDHTMAAQPCGICYRVEVSPNGESTPKVLYVVYNPCTHDADVLSPSTCATHLNGNVEEIMARILQDPSLTGV